MPYVHVWWQHVEKSYKKVTMCTKQRSAGMHWQRYVCDTWMFINNLKSQYFDSKA